MILAGIDLETTGLVAGQDFITELGFVIKEHKNPKPIDLRSFLVHVDGQSSVPAHISDFTKITDEFLENYGVEPPEALLCFLMACKFRGVQAFVAHNMAFDKRFLDHYLSTYLGGMGQEKDFLEWYKSIPWVCTMVDVKYPERFKSKNLVYLAAEHGFLNPFPHAAVFDAMSALKILDFYDVKETLAYATDEKVKVTAGVTYQTKDLAKGQGYSYDPLTKTWHKIVPKSLLEKEKITCKAAGFDIKESPSNGT